MQCNKVQDGKYLNLFNEQKTGMFGNKLMKFTPKFQLKNFEERGDLFCLEAKKIVNAKKL